MGTNCLQPIEPHSRLQRPRSFWSAPRIATLSIYRLLSRYSLRVNKDSNLLRRVLSDYSLYSVEPVTPE